MKYYRTPEADGPHLLARTGTEAYDLTTAELNMTAFNYFAYMANVSDRTIDEVAWNLLNAADPAPVPAETAVEVPTLVDEV